MKNSAGIAFIYDKKMLLCHPTNAPWNVLNIPKGVIEKGETIFEAAAREVKEEVGIDYYSLDKRQIIREPKEIIYRDKRNKAYKKVYYFIVYLNSIEHEIIPTTNLQLEEVDYAKFFTKKEAEKVIFWRFKKLLNYI